MADKGIRPAVNAKFNALLPQRAALGNTAFRKSVMAYAMEEFGITLASAATHYNHAFKVVKAATPELVADLGRAEDKKGGRKPKPKTDDAVAAVGTQIAKDAVQEAVPAATPEQVAAVVDAKDTPLTFAVKRKKDDVVVKSGLTEAEADELVERAKKQKKAYYKA